MATHRELAEQNAASGSSTGSWLPELLHHVPQLWHHLEPGSLSSLIATSSALRSQVHQRVTYICKDMDEEDVKLLTSRQWPCLAQLSIYYSSMGSTTFDALACAPQLHLKSLRFCMSQSALRIDFNRPLFRQLEALQMRRHRFSSFSIQQLSVAEFPMLQALDLGNCGLDAEAITLFAKAPWHNLRTIDLSGNAIGIEGVLALSHAQWPQLEALDLACVKAVGLPISTFLREGGLSHLRHLVLNSNTLCLTSQELLPVSGAPLLKQIYLQNCGFHLPHCRMQDLVSIGFCELEVLDLRQNCLTDDDIEQLAAAPWHNMKELRLDCNGFGADGMAALSLCKWSLERLDLLCLPKGAEALANLSNGVWPNLKTLTLGLTGLTSEGSAALAHGKWPLLEQLYLHDSGIDNSDVIVQLIEGDWPLLNTLDVKFSKVLDESVVSLIKGHWPLLELYCW